MSSEDEDGRSQGEGSETHDNVSTKPKLPYSREFLLSISNSDLCKKLPSGFEESLTSDLEEALLRLPERPRNHGNLPYQGFRRNDYSSSPPTRGDSSTYSRGNYGKWDSRPTRSDREPDSQSDRDSDSGRRFGNPTRRPWQTPEHDGLLGSGSFPRPSGFAAGASAAKVRANEQNQLSRSNEPYHPPRPYKALPHTRKDTDAFNDETFGSLESTNEDRAEQERKRRASFEMMRKEQHKALQEKQSSNTGKTKVDVLSLCEGLMDSKEEMGPFVRNSESEVDSEKSSLSSQTPAPRPLVPPGFKTNPVEKNSGLKPLIHPSVSEVLKPVTSESAMDPDLNLIRNANDRVESQLSEQITVIGRDPLEKTQHTLLFNKGENVNAHVSFDGPKKTVREDQSLNLSSPLETQGLLDGLVFTKLSAETFEDETIHDPSRSSSTSILEKIFGSTLTTKNDGHPGSAELLSNQPDDAWSPKSTHSSKFAQWFSEEEAKAAADVSTVVQNNLLLIVGNDKAAANGVSDQACSNNKEDAVPAVLTCEDLEQSILSEFGAKTTNIQPDSKVWSATGVDPAGHADNHASLHLLSILQKSSELSNTPATSVNISLPEKQVVSHEHDRTTVGNEYREEENGNSSLTLEALFGTAFMKELQSVGAPVSVQRGSSGSSRVDEPNAFPFPVGDNDSSSSAVENTTLQRPSHDYDLPSNHRQVAKMSGGGDNWLGVGESSMGISSPKRQTELHNRHGGFENLISAGDNRDPRVLPLMPGGNPMSSSTPINIAEKMAAFGGVIKDKHSMGGSESMMPPFQHNSYEQRGPDMPFSNLQSPQQFQPPQITQARPLYHHLESHPSHMNSHLKFLSPEPTFGRNSPTNHQLASSPMIRPPFHHPNVRVSGFDVPPQHSVLHQMQMAGNHHPQFARGGPPLHEMNQMQGLPFGRGPNIGGNGVPIPGNPPPEAFQRLIEMELRANSKQIHPFGPPPPGHNQGIYSHELDMESRYR